MITVRVWKIKSGPPPPSEPPVRIPENFVPSCSMVFSFSQDTDQ